MYWHTIKQQKCVSTYGSEKNEVRSINKKMSNLPKKRYDRVSGKENIFTAWHPITLQKFRRYNKASLGKLVPLEILGKFARFNTAKNCLRLCFVEVLSNSKNSRRKSLH